MAVADETQTVTLKIDGQEVTVPEGTTIWQAAREADIEIPALCHAPTMNPVGVCRMCVVDVGKRLLAASCVRACEDGMAVQTSSAKVEKHRAMLTRLLLSDHPTPCRREQTTGDCELEDLGRRYRLLGRQAAGGRMPSAEGTKHEAGDRGQEQGEEAAAGQALPDSPLPIASSTGGRPRDDSSPVIAVDHQACILCDRCIRACDDVQSNEVIGRSGKGYGSQIVFDLNNPMGASTCVSCGECAAACPTGALTHKPITLPITAKDEMQATESVCPYCGVGCATRFYSRDNQLVLAEGRESPVNHGRLCVKGRYGWDYTLHPSRLTRPLIRREAFYPKGPLSSDVKSSIHDNRRKPGGIVDEEDLRPAFREAGWDEAFELISRRFQEIKADSGCSALAGFGSAKGSNEEAYLFQKVIRAGFGTNNVDHCTRLCHASSVAALLETIGSGAVTNVFGDVERAEVALVTGSNTTANHPVAATFIKEAAKKGTKLIVVDVRRHELCQFADHVAQIKPGSDVAFYNAVMHVLIRDELIDHGFIRDRTEGFEQLRQLVLKDYAPEKVADVCGRPAEQIEQIAREIGQARAMMIFWGMGISQHTHGTDNARCLVSLALMTGNVGRPGTGLHPLRGQNNVQGASDAGLIPMVYPDYQNVSDRAVREKFQKAWNARLDPEPGLTVVEIMKGAREGSIRGMYIMGENPFISDPNVNKVREGLSNLDFLAVQDIFLTETAEFADVILPASSYFEKTGTYTNTDRRVQIGRQVMDPPGEARQDWQIICELGRRLGLEMSYESVEDVFAEFTALTTNYNGLRYANLAGTGKIWPCANPDHEDGARILFSEAFPTSSGRGRFVPCPYQAADELPNEEYPFVLNTGRVLEHWHTGSMTRRSRALNTIQPEAFVAVHPDDLRKLGLADREWVRITSRRGTICLKVRSDKSVEPGSVFIPFHYREAAANILTTDVLDPYGKIPEFKFCAVKLEKAGVSEPVSV